MEQRLTEMQECALKLSKGKNGVTPGELRATWYKEKRVGVASRSRFGQISSCYKCLRTLETKGLIDRVDAGQEYRYKKAKKRKQETRITRARRRYYLHQQIKKHFSYRARMHHIEVTEEEISRLPLKIQEYLYELRDRFKYNLQFYIGEAIKKEKPEK